MVTAMIELGPNLKLSVHPEHRETLRLVFERGLGLVRTSPVGDWDLFAVARGGTIGVAYVEHALSPELARQGAWIEVLISDPDAAAVRLSELGLEPFPYADHTRRYYEAPGGQVFRLAEH